MKSYNRVFFLRHLETQNNRLHIISGQSDSPIIETRCSKVDLSKFDRIYCSSSKRCVKTLQLMGEQINLISNIVYDKRLLERDMGILESISKEEGKNKYPELFRKENFNVFETPPQGESFESFQKRIKEFYSEYLCTYERLSILICSHNQVLKLLRLLMLEKDITHQSWSEISFENGKIVEIN